MRARSPPFPTRPYHGVLSGNATSRHPVESTKTQPLSASMSDANAVDVPAARRPLPPADQLDPDGDLLLHVGTKLASVVNHRVFKVCSAALRRASPVWKVMLFGPFTEAKPAEGDWVVELPEDDPETLKILLGLLHGVFAAIPPTLPLAVLCGVLVVADKYDLFHLLRPVVNAWVAVVKIPTLPPPAPTSNDSSAASLLDCADPFNRIHAAWSLGGDTFVAQDLTYFVFNFSRKANSFALQNRLVQPASHCGPPDLMGTYPECPFLHATCCHISLMVLTIASEIVTKLRLSLTQSLLDFYHEEVACRIPPKIGCAYTPYGSRAERPLCDSVILGGMWQRLETYGESRLPKSAAEYSGSANDLMTVLRGIFSDLPAYSTAHNRCLPSRKFADFEWQTRWTSGGRTCCSHTTNSKWRNTARGVG